MDEPFGEPSTLTRIERVVFGRRVGAHYASLVLHVLALLGLAAWTAKPTPSARVTAIRLECSEPDGWDAGGGVVIDTGAMPARPPEPEGDASSEADSAILEDTASAPVLVAPPPMADPTPLAAPSPSDQALATRIAATVSPAAAAGGQWAEPEPVGPVAIGRAFATRRGPARGAAVRRHGGSAASEAAVERGLEWLARHQASDGSWRFDLSDCQCNGGCSLPGTVTSTTAATGIALLPFLGAGSTHEEGPHRETVTRGLYYLMSRSRPTARGGDLSEGTMYGHGVAALALAEALGMTGDRMLVPYVRDAVRFIETAQDLHGGGWRYLPGQAGDTTVTAWQLAALKSASLAGVPVPSPTIDGVCRFLDRVQVRDGEAYGYLGPGDRPCTSAIGLLCRIYTSWPREAVVDRGLGRLAKAGPSPDDVYANFYLSQALLLRGHPVWKRWNPRNRDQLVASQSRIGHESGSWSFVDADTRPGGRLGQTALAVLTLEVYYRILPIYGDAAAESGW
jgi:hypothetical protein